MEEERERGKENPSRTQGGASTLSANNMGVWSGQVAPGTHAGMVSRHGLCIEDMDGVSLGIHVRPRCVATGEQTRPDNCKRIRDERVSTG